MTQDSGPTQPGSATYVAGASQPSRIHIVGGSGTGKTTLARRIGRLRGLPIYHLDDIARTSATEEARRARAESMSSGPAWVSEGIQTTWSEPFFEGAEMIVWLDSASSRAAIRRVARRFVTSSIRETRSKGLRSALRFRSYAKHSWQLVRHFREVRHYYAEPAGSGQTHYTREGTAELLERWPGRVVHCESTADLNALLNCIATADPARTTGPANGLSL